MSNPYRLYGLVLAICGAILIPVFYFIIGSVPLTAVALSAVILGLTGIFLANARPYLSPAAAQTLLKTGMENTSALLEELGVQTKAIYLPSSLRQGKQQALIPLSGDIDVSKIKGNLPGRLIVRYGSNPADMALAVTTAGGVNLEILETKPGPTAEEIESALNYLLTGVLDIAQGVSVKLDGRQIEINISGARLGYEDIWYYRCLGSPIASIAAAVCCEAIAQPVRIVSETLEKKRARVVLEIFGQE